MDFDEEEPTQMELNPNPALRTGSREHAVGRVRAHDLDY